MRIIATPIMANKVKAGDLFSTANQNYWDSIPPDSIGEKVYIRTAAPCPKGQESEVVYKITIIEKEV